MESSITSHEFRLAGGRHHVLGRDYAAASRLNLQYHFWKEKFLHINAHLSVPIPKEACVADVATGTATWLIDVAREHPTAQIDGFDIDLSQAPPKQWLSPTITLKTWNVFDPPSEDMIEDYDVVHVRLLVLVVQGSDPRNIIRNLLRMLKPGVYIHWAELNYPDTYIRNNDGSLLTPARIANDGIFAGQK